MGRTVHIIADTDGYSVCRVKSGRLVFDRWLSVLTEKWQLGSQDIWNYTESR